MRFTLALMGLTLASFRPSLTHTVWQPQGACLGNGHLRRQQDSAHLSPQTVSSHLPVTILLLIWFKRCTRNTIRHVVLMTVCSMISQTALDLCGWAIKNFRRAESREGATSSGREGLLLSYSGNPGNTCHSYGRLRSPANTHFDQPNPLLADG